MNIAADHHSRGIMHAKTAEQFYTLTRYLPSPHLSGLVKHYWVVRWDLRGHAPYRQTILSHPNVNLVFEREGARVYGVSPATSDHMLEDAGWVIGVKFMPGGFYPFWQASISELTGKSVRMDEAFRLEGASPAGEIYAMGPGEEAVRRVESFLEEQLAKLPAPDGNIKLVSDVVGYIQDDRSVMKVADAARHAGLHVRTLQRLFERYVGVSPKWVIQRYRLHEALDAAERGAATDWPRLAAELGYYDQPHFIRDFKALTGQSPEEYVRAQSSVPAGI